MIASPQRRKVMPNYQRIYLLATTHISASENEVAEMAHECDSPATTKSMATAHTQNLSRKLFHDTTSDESSSVDQIGSPQAMKKRKHAHTPPTVVTSEQHEEEDHNLKHEYNITISQLDTFAWIAVCVQAALACLSVALTFATNDFRYSVGTSALMWSFGLVIWTAGLPDGASIWPFFFSVLVVPFINGLGFMVNSASIFLDDGAGSSGYLPYLFYGIIPLFTWSFPWFSAGFCVKGSLCYSIDQSLGAMWRMTLGALPVLFIAAGGLTGGGSTNDKYDEYSWGCVALIEPFQAQVLQIALLAYELWRRTCESESAAQTLKKFGRADRLASIHMYFMIVVALCFKTLLHEIKSISVHSSVLLQIYWYMGPMAQLLALQIVSKHDSWRTDINANTPKREMSEVKVPPV